MKPCPTCSTQNEDSAAFCDNCGAALGGGASAPVAPPIPQQQYAPPPPPMPAPGGGSMACPQCGTQNMPGTMFCDNCGAALSNVAPPPMPSGQPPAYTPPAYTPPPAPVYTPPPAQPAYQPPMGALPPMPCRLMIAGQQVPVPAKAEAIIGRADLASGWNPDVDLTPYGGTPDAGVSRKHLKIVWQNAWMVEDMNSVNGSYLRGQRLAPSQRTPVNNGEVIQLGKLQITFFAQ